MYKGHRDDHLAIRVPQRLCHLYKSKLDEEFVEVCLPGSNKKRMAQFHGKPFTSMLRPQKSQPLQHRRRSEQGYENQDFNKSRR